jgi:hypothetical protein
LNWKTNSGSLSLSGKPNANGAPFAGHNEAEARRDAEIADRQIFAIDLQIDRIERALEDCRAYGGRR